MFVVVFCVTSLFVEFGFFVLFVCLCWFIRFVYFRFVCVVHLLVSVFCPEEGVGLYCVCVFRFYVCICCFVCVCCDSRFFCVCV